jgi:hypothetical protein
MKNLNNYINESNKVLQDLYLKLDNLLNDYQDFEFPTIEFYKRAPKNKQEELSTIIDEIRKIESSK